MKMKRARDQLSDEVNFPHLANFLQSGGKLEVGEDLSMGGFARIRKGNRIVLVDTGYRDFAAILKTMDSQARDWDVRPPESWPEELVE